MLNKISSFILAGILLGCFADVANGCSCSPSPSPCFQLGTSKAVFVGLVTSVTTDDIVVLIGERKRSYKQLVVHFNIEEPLKEIEQKSVEIVTGLGGGDCGYPFKTGERYLIYAQENHPPPTTAAGKTVTVISGGPSLTVPLKTHLCSRTKPVAEAADDIDLIRAQNAGKPETRIFGRILDYTLHPGPSPSYVRPMAGLTVKAENENNRYEALTDADGRYRFSNVDPGKYKVTVLLPKSHKIVNGSGVPEANANLSATCGAEIIFGTQQSDNPLLNEQ